MRVGLHRPLAFDVHQPGHRAVQHSPVAGKQGQGAGQVSPVDKALHHRGDAIQAFG